MANLRAIRRDLFFCRGSGIGLDGDVGSDLVCETAETVLQPAELGVWAGVVHTLLQHGRERLAGVAKCRVERSQSGFHPLLYSAGIQSDLVRSIFRPSPTR